MSQDGTSSADDKLSPTAMQPYARLLKREREKNILMRQLASIDRWSSATVSLASAVSGSANPREALDKLGGTLVDELNFDYARMIWGDVVVEYPALDELQEIASIEQLIAFEAEVESRAKMHEMAKELPFAEIRRYAIASRHRPAEEIIFFTGYRWETFRYIEADDSAARLAELSQLLVHPFDSLRLRMDLIRERDTLQDKVDAATKDLREALNNAYAARVAAERAAQVRSQFLAHMSHEIRTPMTAILGYAELLSDAKPTGEEERARYLNIIKVSGRHLLQLLNDVLDLARIESGVFTLDPVDGSVPQLLADVLSLLRVRAVTEGLELRLRFDGLLPTLVRADLLRLRQILLNIMGNALKFTERGWVEVRARIDPAEAEGMCELVMEVEDSGVGISGEALAAIFEEFHTERRTLSSQRGTGLGLAISQRLARLMGGRIDVQSQLGKGTCFIIRVQAELLEGSGWVPGVDALIEPEEHESVAFDDRFSGRVLLVEDTRVIRGVVTAYLNKMGVEVEAVEDGLAACEAVEAAKTPYDLILMDMQMPRMDGYEATRRLRAEGLRVPIVALTAHAMVGERERCIAAGCSDYLTKPVDRGKLYTMLQTYLPSDAQEAVRKTIMGEDDVLAALMADFYADLAQQKEELGRLMASEDIRNAGSLAHKLAGSASTFGFPDLAARAREFEQVTRSGRVTLLPELCRNLVREIKLVLKANVPS